MCRNVKRWRYAKMGLLWTAMGMLEAKKGFRRLMPYKHLPVLKATCQNHRNGQTVTPAVNRLVDAAYCSTSIAILGIFNRVRDIPLKPYEPLSSKPE